MSSTALKNAEARIQLLCSLGLDGQAILPTLLKELRTAIPFGSALYARGESNQIVDIYAEHPDITAAIPEYESCWLAAEAKVMPIISDTLKTSGPRLLQEKLIVSPKQYYNSEIYNELLLDCEVHHMQCGTLRLHGKPTGVLSLYRGKKEQDFTSEHLKTWCRLESFMAHALSHKRPDFTSAFIGNDHAPVITDARGKVLFISPNARQSIALSQLSAQQFEMILTQLCQRLNALRLGQPQSAPPIMYHHNSAGRWEIRAHWLEPNEPGDSLIGIMIQHKAPIELKLFELVATLGLPVRTGRVCVHLMLDDTQEQISQKLGISVHTVIDHRRQIYARLNVTNRAEFKQKIMQMSKAL